MKPSNHGGEFTARRPRAVRRLIIVAGVLVATGGFYLGICYLILSSALTPVRKTGPTPQDSGLAVKPVILQSDVDGTPLLGWLLPSSGDRAMVLVHGLDSHAWDGAHADIAQAYVEAGFHVLVFDLRGHGRSGGDQLGLGWLERRDVRAAVDHLLTRKFRSGRIGVHGTSYGAATALLSAAAIPEIGAVMADSSFADVRDIMDAQIESRTGIPSRFSRLFLRPGIALVAKMLFSLDLDLIPPERAAPSIARRPVLFIHGSEDRVIPVEHAHRLKAASKNPADELWILDGYGHTEGVRLDEGKGEPSPIREAFLRKVSEFFAQALR